RSLLIVALFAYTTLFRSRLVLIGEASHGTSEFYRARAAITRRLIEQHGFTIVAVEADWPDAAAIDCHVRQRPAQDWHRQAFERLDRKSTRLNSSHVKISY